MTDHHFKKSMNTDGSDVAKEMEVEDEASEDLAFEADNETLQDKIKILRKKLTECEKKGLESLTGWQRARADLVNYRKDVESQLSQQTQRVIRGVIEELLPVLDSFSLAFQNPTWKNFDSTWRKGLEGVRDQLLVSLKMYGLEPFAPSENEVFDPNLHESIQSVNTTSEDLDHKISHTLQEGYRIHGEVIRPAKVIIFSYNEKPKQ